MKRFFLLLPVVLLSCTQINEPINPNDPTPGVLVAPVATIGQARDITQTSAKLVGWIIANERGTTAYFEYRADQELYYTSIRINGTYSGTEAQEVTFVLKGLTPETKYRYRLRPSNQAGGIATREEVFTTLKKETI